MNAHTNSPTMPIVDEIGIWSEVKLEIIKKYAKAYNANIKAQPRPPGGKPFQTVYVDGFAGTGIHITKHTGEFVLGSPWNALNVRPPFDAVFLVDLNGDKVQQLQSILPNVESTKTTIIHGDCNTELIDNVFPKIQYTDYMRGLCVLDPYGLHLDWKVIEAAASKKSIEIFLNFPIMDMNRNVLRHNHATVSENDRQRMNLFWGDDSWQDAAYSTNPQLGLFGSADKVKTDNVSIVRAFQKRLRDVAKFKCVPDPMPMRNSTNAVVYYLFFASHKPVAQKIVTEIFDNFRNG